MKKNLIVLVVLFISGVQFAFATIVGASLQPENLRCEYLDNPIGLDELIPRFNWTHKATNAAAFGQKQTAYRIIVASDVQLLHQTEGMNGTQVG